MSNVVIAWDKDYSIYWLGNNQNEAPNLGQNALLQWESIKMMKKNGCKYYDLCFIEKNKLPHIYKFKKGFSNTEVPVSLVLKTGIGFKIFNKIKSAF